MMKTRKGHKVYPLTCSAEIPSVLSAFLSHSGSAEHWYQRDY